MQRPMDGTRGMAAPPMRTLAAATSVAITTSRPRRSSGLAQEMADRLTSEAKSEADAMLSDARNKSEQLLSDARTKSDGLVNDARSRAETMLNDARTRAETLERQSRDKAAQLVGDAERKQTEIIGSITRDKSILEKKIDELRFPRSPAGRFQLLRPRACQLWQRRLSGHGPLEPQPVEAMRRSAGVRWLPDRLRACPGQPTRHLRLVTCSAHTRLVNDPQPMSVDDWVELEHRRQQGRLALAGKPFERVRPIREAAR